LGKQIKKGGSIDKLSALDPAVGMLAWQIEKEQITTSCLLFSTAGFESQSFTTLT
jgi:hypothetical protein